MQDIKSFNEEAFIKVHESGEQLTSVRLNPSRKIRIDDINFLSAGSALQPVKVPWSEYGYYLAQRPSFTFDPLFHAGCYYVQEASSMFIEQALKQTVDVTARLKILDLSASPGGKSTHIQSLISKKSLLVSNEVIRSRANILKDNIMKWGADNVVVTSNDPADFANLENYFDVILVDAPCSGSGLFRRDPVAMEEWSLNNVQLCSQRQQRILAAALPALRKNGILIYSTRSYSMSEDEDISGWLMQSFPLRYRPLNTDVSWGITDTGQGYRCWPDKLKGEGFFISCFQKTSGEEAVAPRVKESLEPVSRKETGVLTPWVKTDRLLFYKNEQTVYGWTGALAQDFNFILKKLRVVYSGLLAGELIRDKFIPAHSLALSPHLSENVNRHALNREEAVAYLQRKTPLFDTEKKGWQVVTYKDFPLGWINVLQGRINNYYPKELRIIKEN